MGLPPVNNIDLDNGLQVVRLTMERAGLTNEVIELATPDNRFDNIVEALRAVHQGKGVLYGNYIETHGTGPELWCLMGHYMDLKRKGIRAEQFMQKRCAGDVVPIEELLDTYADMAVYAMLGIQLIIHLNNKVTPVADLSDEEIPF